METDLKRLIFYYFQPHSFVFYLNSNQVGLNQEMKSQILPWRKVLIIYYTILTAYKGYQTNWMGNSSKRGKVQTKEQLQKQSLSIRLQGRELKQLGYMIFQRLPEDVASLSLHQCSVGEQGCKILAKARWPHLKNLIITENKVGDKGIAILVKAEMPNLINLNLSGNFLTDASCRTVTKGNWKKIQNMTFNDSRQQKRINRITKFGVNYLQQLNLKNLDEIRQKLIYRSYLYFREINQYDYL